MGEYVYTIICASLFSAVIIALSPGGEGGKLTKLIAFAGALAMALTLLSPLPDLWSEEGVEFFGNISDSHNISSEKEGEYYANSAGMALSEIYGTELSAINAEVYTDDDDKIVKILLQIEGKVLYSTEEAGEILTQIYGMNVEVRDG